ncbi:cell division protein SufI [Stackebrandtia albiflava]|uniref:Multicopper oxidase CueO n=1 Tax=Stackebrandtia albiflava TaxID=406432 RepID=A0A562V1L9_9ACTN|nr:multicopper oxidase domain-containing protein [Stackebrandtia albiflava]TWJ11697.1 cell division protein SufI [Stackebrandtia albiflava]
MSTSPTPRLTRRRVLGYGLAGVGVLAAGAGGVVGALLHSAKTDTVGEVDFATPLHIPELATGQRDADGRLVFDLQLKEGSRRFLPGESTRTWGFNGDYLGPTLRARRGDHVVVNVRNSLPETSSVHWHGMHLPAAMDGGPHQAVAPTDTWSPEWTVDQPAATLWYHPHPHGATAKHVYRGLAGLFLVDDDAEAALPLPREYGVDDVPVVVQDRAFDGGNQFDDAPHLMSSAGVLGDHLLVNGTYGPYLDVSTRRVRLRLLNGSNARVYQFAFSDDRPLTVIASDGGLLAAPHATRRLQLSPGERAEVIVEFTPGETVVLRSEPPELMGDFFTDRVHGGDDRFDVLEFRAAAELADSPPLPDTLVEVPPLPVDEAVTTRTFELSGFRINKSKMDMSRIDFGVRRDSVEIWEIVNVDASLHNFHVHDVQFQVLSIGGEAPPAELAGWKDTVQVWHGRPVRVAMRFSDFTDPDMPYMYHCHILYHEDSGLMGQFVVLDEGQEVGVVPTDPAAGHHDHD